MLAGGVTSMDNFLQKFFPDTYNRQTQDTALMAAGLVANNPYCTPHISSC